MANKEFRIAVQKNVRDGEPVLSAASPQGENATSPSSSLKKTALLGYGALLANRTYSTVVQEIKASGNEELATQLSNISKGASFAAGLIATKGLSIIPETINSAATLISRYRASQRSSKIDAYQTSLRGSRINYNQGSVYFD